MHLREPLVERSQRARRELALMEALQHKPNAIALKRIRHANVDHFRIADAQQLQQSDVRPCKVLHQIAAAHSAQNVAHVEEERWPAGGMKEATVMNVYRLN